MTEKKTKFCVNCGAEIDARAEICPKCRVRVAPPPSTQPSSETLKAKGKPKIGLIGSIIGGLIIFVASIVYLVIGVPIAGVLGIIFVAASIFFVHRGYVATEKKTQQISGAIPMFIGLFIMIASGTLLAFDMTVIIGGFILTLGGIFISAGK